MTHRSRRAFAAAVCAALFLSPLAVGSWAQDDMCLGCHVNKDMAAEAPQMEASKFQRSVHKDLGCLACHLGKDTVPHDQKETPVSCEGCHRAKSDSILASDHGKLLLKTKSGAALCISCHGPPHELRRASDSASKVSRVNIPTTCNQCHQKLDFKAKFGIDPFASYAMTVHGKAHTAGNLKAAVCTDCHGGHDLNFSNNSRSSIFKFNVPQTCGRCHTAQVELYARSIHGKKIAAGVKDAPVCTDCHGEHNIQGKHEPGSMVYTGSIVKTCSACHGSERLIAKFGMLQNPAKTYIGGYHGVAFVAGNLSAANCASCHRHHDILPPEDPGSSVNPQNLQRTCGACHQRAGELVNMGKVHLSTASAAGEAGVEATALDLYRGGGRAALASETLLPFVRRMYVWIIVLTIGGMLLHNALYHLRKIVVGLDHAHDPDELRLSRNERLQHWVLLASFIGLAYTGFCHSYPESVISVFHGAGGAAVRALLHRVLAGVFIALAAYHFSWLASTTEGRRELGAMLPAGRAFLDFLQMQRC
ncbi:MAG: cytochrome c3 family protein, partial [Elusimicrobiota bacterium]